MRRPLLLLVLSLAGCTHDVGEVSSDLRRVTFSVEPIGRFTHGPFDETAAEVGAYDARSARLFVVNGSANAIDVLDLSDPSSPTLAGRVELSEYGGSVNCVAARRGVVVAVVEAHERTEPGRAVFFEARSLDVTGVVAVGAQPDMVALSPDGRYAVVANEGEPNDDYSVDPEGSISVVTMWYARPLWVRTANFRAYDHRPPAGVRISGPDARASQDFEPEYVTISEDSRTAWVSLQENNAVATVDLHRARVTRVAALGEKDHSLPGNGLDASNRDDAINIATWPVRGLYMPDALASYRVRGRTYLVLANEGDARDYDTFADEARIGSLALDPTAFPNGAELRANANLGRLHAITTEGDHDGDGDYDALYTFGARSFSIRDAWGRLVWDSGDEIEQTMASLHPANFNANDNENDLDGRSDDKGPEPEPAVVAELFGRHYAFIGLERMGGILIYDVERPSDPQFVDYVETRDFGVEPGPDSDAGDLAPEGIIVVPAYDSPTRRPLLIATYEMSGTTRVFEIVRD